MKMKEHLQMIYKVLAQDETLLRLLYYKPVSAADDPLDVNKQNVLDRTDKWDIIDDVIKTAQVVVDLDTTQKCRLLIYPGQRRSTNNYLFANQDFVFDILVHSVTFDAIDQRLSWLSDHINELIFNQRITGIGKIQFVSGTPIGAPNGYSGYRLVYNFGSQNN